MRSRLQQKSQPRNARLEISVVACAEISRALRLCREFDSRGRQEHAQNGDKIDAAESEKTTTLSRAYTLAGHVGLELGNVVTNYPVESSIDFRESSRIPATETIRA